MIAKLASKMTMALKHNKIILENEFEIYQYGLEMIISTIINCAIVVLCGVLLNEILAAALFFILFALIRSSSGGYHASTYLKCNSIFAVNLIAAMFWVKFAHPFYSDICHIIFILIYILMIIKYAPIENPNKPLSDHKKKQSKRLCFIYGIVLTAISFVLWHGLDLKKYAMIIVAAMLSAAFSMAITILKNGDDIYEKDYS
ncbi:MAG: accessory gene regulator B family protein [Ruminococcus sp.]|nr:accessory gene regulator B family protein [Ruminococcus sp.]